MKLTLEFGGREFTLTSNEPPEVVDEVKKRLEKSLKEYEEYVDEFPREDVLFVILANAILQQIEMEKRMEEIVAKLKEWSYEGGVV